MITLRYEQTKFLIFFVLDYPLDSQLREKLYLELKRIKSNEGQFYAGIIEHGPHMKLTSDQWFKLLSRLPNRILRSELPLKRILSLQQLAGLPPPIG